MNSTRLLLRVGIVVYLVASALWLTRALVHGRFTAPRPVSIVQPR